MKQPRAMFQVATNKKDTVHKFAEKVKVNKHYNGA
jgi:hypothetical protein